MTDWTAFVGVTAVVVTLFLGLARLSQGLVRSDESTDPDAVVDDGAALGIDVPDGGAATPTSTRDEAPRATPDSPAPPRGEPDIARLSPGALLANVALTQGIFGVAVAAAAVYFAVPPSALGLSAAPLSTGPPAVAVGVGFGVALWLGNEAAAAVADAAGVAYDERLRELLAPETLGGWVVLLGATLPVIAGVEELLFRAAFIGPPSVAYGVSPWALAVVASLAFALGHGAQGTTGMVVTGALGFALAAGFVLTGSLVVVVIAHYLVNALEFVVHEGLGFDRPFGWVG